MPDAVAESVKKSVLVQATPAHAFAVYAARAESTTTPEPARTTL